MKQESKRLTSIIVAALIIAAALVVYFELIVPTYTNLETLKGETESNATAYANETQIVNEVKSLLTTYQSDTSSSQSVAMALPVGPDISGALAQIYGIAANTGITLTATGISVQAVQVVTPSAANASTAQSIVKPTGTVSFQVAGSGSYESFKNFLAGLATNIRIFNVTAIAIQPAGVAASSKTPLSNPDMFNYTITVVTYYQAP